MNEISFDPNLGVYGFAVPSKSNFPWKTIGIVALILAAVAFVGWYFQRQKTRKEAVEKQKAFFEKEQAENKNKPHRLKD